MQHMISRLVNTLEHSIASAAWEDLHDLSCQLWELKGALSMYGGRPIVSFTMSLRGQLWKS